MEIPTHIILLYSGLVISYVAAGGNINYGRIGDNLPPPATVAQFVKSQNIAKVRIFDADAGVLAAFASQGIPVAVTVGNGDIPALAASQDSAAAFATRFTTGVSMVMVGNEVLKYNPELASQLVPAMRNLRAALVSAGAASVLVSTATAMDVLDSSASFPPSAGVFRADTQGTMRDVLDFLSQSGAPLLVNVYPFFAYRDDGGRSINLAYALLQEDSAPGVDDSGSGLHYKTMLDAQLDTIYSAMAKSGHADVRIVVSETGWPWGGGDLGASVDNAGTFNRNLLRIAASGRGTPARPSMAIEAYIFSLFNENQKPGADSEKCFGVFNADMSKVYAIDF